MDLIVKIVTTNEAKHINQYSDIKRMLLRVNDAIYFISALFDSLLKFI
jgi:hypothetical protein